MRKIEPLNYCNQAIKDIDIDWLPNLTRMGYKVSAHNANFTARNLKNAMKFMIPNGDSILHQKLPKRHELTHLHLPYPIVAVEYKVEDVVVTPYAPVPSQRRISLIFEVEGDKNEAFPTPFGCLVNDSGGWVIIPLWHEPIQQHWCISHTALAIKREQPDRKPGDNINRISYEDDDDRLAYKDNLTGDEVSKLLDSLKKDQRKILLDYESYETPFLPEIVQIMIDQYGPQKVKEITIRDTFDEIVTAMAFLYASSCTNIKTQLINPVKESVNRKRISKGKLPFFEYHALVVDTTKPKKVYARKEPDPTQPKRRSPRFHFRTGHPRTIPSQAKPIWIPHTTVGNAENGIVEKDYFLFTGE